MYIQTDIEGVAGFCFFENRADKGYENVQHRRRMYRLLTGEVNAAVKAAFDSGADEVLVNDSHSSGYNIIFEDLDPRCRIIHGRNCSGPHWLPMLDDSFDALVLVGMHAMGETPNAILPHSKWKVNGGAIYLSEGSMAAAIAGDYSVPTVFVSGDDKIAAEIKDKIPRIETTIVKQALSVYQACSVIPARACEMIYTGVKKGIERRSEIKPFHIPGPVRLNLLDAPGFIDLKEVLPEDVEAPTIDQAFMEFERRMSWTCFDTSKVDGFVFP
ncbi:MAG: M55 family metallopeptidase [Lentisphaerota bacterium]